MNAEQIAKKMLKRQEMVEKEFRQTTRGVAISALAFTKMKLTEEIYAIPEDLTRRGRERQRQAREAGRRFVARKGDREWVRTGHLRRSEKFDIRSAYEVAVVNTAAYAIPRHEAGKPGHRKINPARVSHWRDDLREAFGEAFLQDLYHQTVVDILKAEGG